MATVEAKGKGVAIVTGAAMGIGRGVALKLAQDGFDVAVNDLAANEHLLESLVKEIEALKDGGKAIVAIADVALEEQVEKMVEKTVQELGAVDVMVANAGIAIMRSILDTTCQDWDHIMSVNARGLFFCYKYAARQMIKQGHGGRIIGVSSTAGKRGEPLMGVYTATKAAVRGLTQVAAQEWGAHGITVNSVAPGGVDTPMLRTIGGPFWDQLEGSTKSTPYGKFGQPEDIAPVVAFLASKESRFITGVTLSVDGGRLLD